MSKRGKQGGKAREELKAYFSMITSHKAAAAVIVVGLAAVIAGGVFIGFYTGRNSSVPSSQGTAESASAAAENTEEATETTVPEEALEENAYPEVNQLIADYFQAMADGDVEKIQQLKDGNDENELIRIQKKSVYVEQYENLNCYTKKGPEEGSFVVYASYEVKFSNMERLVPGMNALYVRQKEDGSYYIDGQELDDETYEFIEALSLQDDVRELNNKVQVAYNDAVTEDAQLAAYLQAMSDDVIAAVGEELESQEVAQTEPETVEATVMPDGTKAKATDVVNVRKSDSEAADKVGKVQIGDEVVLLEERANGWSKIEFEGETAYIKSEFLEKISDEEEADVEEGQQPEQEEEEQEAQNNNTADASVPNSGTYRVTETINIRKSTSETADKIGVCYPGETLEIVMKQADGWTKVKYNGKTGYVKSDVLK